MEDHTLFEKLKNGDQTAINGIYKIYVKKTFYIINAIVHNPEDAEELTNDVFLELYKRRHTLDTSKSVNAYIKKIATNKAINFMRDHYIKNRIISLLEVSDIPTPAPDAQRTMELKELQQNMDAAIESIPNVQCRDSFVLAQIEEKKHMEIATILGIKAGVVKKYVYLARKIMMNFLKKRGM